MKDNHARKGRPAVAVTGQTQASPEASSIKKEESANPASRGPRRGHPREFRLDIPDYPPVNALPFGSYRPE